MKTHKLFYIGLIGLVLSILFSCKSSQVQSTKMQKSETKDTVSTYVKSTLKNSINCTSKDTLISTPEEVNLFKVNSLNDTTYIQEDSTGYSVISVKHGEVSIKEKKFKKTILVPKVRETIITSKEATSDSIRAHYSNSKDSIVSNTIKTEKVIPKVYQWAFWGWIIVILGALIFAYFKVKKWIL